MIKRKLFYLSIIGRCIFFNNFVDDEILVNMFNDKLIINGEC